MTARQASRETVVRKNEVDVGSRAACWPVPATAASGSVPFELAMAGTRRRPATGTRGYHGVRFMCSYNDSERTVRLTP